jgi:THO complex subunit 3
MVKPLKAGDPREFGRGAHTHRTSVQKLSWASDGRRLVSGASDGSLRVWSAETLGSLAELSKGPLVQASQNARSSGSSSSGAIEDVVWEPLGNDLVAAIDGGSSLRIWDLRTPRVPAMTLPTPPNPLSLCWAPNGHTLGVSGSGSASQGDCVSFLDLRTKGTATSTLQTEEGEEINGISWTWDGSRFLIATGQGALQVFDWPSLLQQGSLPASTSGLTCLSLDPRGRFVVVGGADALVSLWDLEHLSCERTFGALHSPLRSVSVSFDGELVASGGSDDALIDIVCFSFL